MHSINPFSAVGAKDIAAAAEQYHTPLYLYDENMIVQRCKNLLSMPNPFGLTVRYAMKANSTKQLLQLIHRSGLQIDASSMNEARRAHLAGIPYQNIILTTQEVPLGEERLALEDMMQKGMHYNVCSYRQLDLVADFAAANNIKLSMRVHPGIGSGESASRNTGDNYSCFGVHLSNIESLLDLARRKGIQFSQVHTHIGSGGDPEMWKSNIDLELGILEKYFPDADSISFGGGLKDARMPHETSADIQQLGIYAKQQLEAFSNKTGRKLKMEIEPGTYVVANAGYIVTRVLDKKRTGDSGLNFLVVDGGMEMNARPLLYGSHHPIYVISQEGELLSSEFQHPENTYAAVVAGRCCESGDCQTLDENGLSSPRSMAEPNLDDYLVIGGAGAYCSSMAPFNYNSHPQAPEVLLTASGQLQLIRRRQTLEQMLENEL